MFKNIYVRLALALFLVLAPIAYAQNASDSTATKVQPTQSLYYMTPISATAAVNNQVTLTIPAPSSGNYNYVCSLAYIISQDGTATAATNSVTTSTNFNSFALKYSVAATANLTLSVFSQVWGSPAGGCVKSTSPSTATTFVSPAAAANTAFSWYATYYQAP